MRATERQASARAAEVTVNGVLISEACIDREVQYHPASSLSCARAQAIRALVIRELLLHKAAKLQLSCLDNDSVGEVEETDEAGLIQALLAREIKPPAVDEDTCQRYYRNNRQHFHTPPLYQAAHILFATAPTELPAREAIRRQAEATLAELQSSPEKFSTLAKKHSACSSGQQGGSLGQIESGQTVSEFEQQLAQMIVGEICPRLVATRFGFHIVRLDHRVAGRQLPFEAVQKQIRGYLEESAWRRAVSQYLHHLLAEAEIVGIDLLADALPVMQ